MQNAGYAAADAARITNNVMKIETALAQKTLTREESRDIPRMYNPRTFARVKEVYPNVNWDRFFIETMGIKSPDTLIVTEPEYPPRPTSSWARSPTARSRTTISGNT